MPHHINDVHCHFFSQGFLSAIGREVGGGAAPAPVDPATLTRLGWDSPGSDAALADRWIAELDRYGVGRAMLIASLHGDEGSVGAALARHPSRFVGAFMINPAAPDAPERLDRAFGRLGMRVACLFPAMHRVRLDDPVVDDVFAAASRARGAVFVHCGVLTIGVRKKLGLPSRFDMRLGDPLAVAGLAARHPDVPVIVPHFGAGLFREALIAADAAPNLHLDTSSSNSWIKYHPRLTLDEVFARALDVAGPERLLFGTDSSFFPRGWQAAIHTVQRDVLDRLGVGAAQQALIFGGNFARIFKV